MSKIITVWGSPNSGKTTFAIKLANSIYKRKRKKIAVVFCDNQTPALPIVFPNLKEDKLFSLGSILSNPEIIQEDIIQNMMSVKSKPNIVYLGYKYGENKYSYPAFDNAKACEFFDVLKSVVDYVIIDCSNDLSDILSEQGIIQSDIIMRLVNPTTKSMSFCSSMLPVYADIKYKSDTHIIILNINDNTTILPLDETKLHFKNVRFTLPFCLELKEQMQTGYLLHDTRNKKYTKIIDGIVDRVV